MRVDLALVGIPQKGDNYQYLVKYHDHGVGRGRYSKSGFPLGEVYDPTWRNRQDTIDFCKQEGLEIVYIQPIPERSDKK